MKYRILLIFALLSLSLQLAAEIALPFDRNWKLPPNGTISESILTISATDSAVPQLASHPIDPEPYFGRSLIVRFEVKYSDVSKPKESYNGVKLMIHYFANGKQYWTNCPPLYGSSDSHRGATDTRRYGMDFPGNRTAGKHRQIASPQCRIGGLGSQRTSSSTGSVTGKFPL